MNKYLRDGITGGLSLAFFHLCWVVVVAIGWGQTILDFVFKIHMLNSPLQVQPFNPACALTLLLVTFTVGFVMGIVIGASTRRRRWALCASEPRSIGNAEGMDGDVIRQG